jgi:hypothetical protein
VERKKKTKEKKSIIFVCDTKKSKKKKKKKKRPPQQNKTKKSASRPLKKRAISAPVPTIFSSISRLPNPKKNVGNGSKIVEKA